MKIVNKLKSADGEKLIGFKDEEAFFLEFSKIETIYTENKSKSKCKSRIKRNT